MDHTELTKQINLIVNKHKNVLNKIISDHSNIFIFGNGGSHSIAEHISQDYRKFLDKNTFTISNNSIITAFSNDYGFENLFLNYLKSFKNFSNILVILISSSGNSNNIINCAKYCNHNKIDYISLSGFNEKNSLNILESNNCLLKVWVNSKSYGIVELAHESLLHSIVDN